MISIVLLYAFIVPFTISYRSGLFRSDYDRSNREGEFIPRQNFSQKSIDDVVDGYIEAKGLKLKIKYQCKVIYPGGHRIDSKHEMKYEHVLHKPNVTWPYNSSSLYTLVFVHTENYKLVQRYLDQAAGWIVANIRGNNIDAGTVLCDYRLPYTSDSEGNQRYVFGVYEQSATTDYASFKPLDDPRKRFVLEFFVVEYDLGLPIASNFFKLITHPPSTASCQIDYMKSN